MVCRSLYRHSPNRICSCGANCWYLDLVETSAQYSRSLAACRFGPFACNDNRDWWQRVSRHLSSFHFYLLTVHTLSYICETWDMGIKSPLDRSARKLQNLKPIWIPTPTPKLALVTMRITRVIFIGFCR